MLLYLCVLFIAICVINAILHESIIYRKELEYVSDCMLIAVEVFKIQVGIISRTR